MGTREVVAAQSRAHVARWRASGLSRAGYCTREGLSESAFGYWVSKANRGARAATGEPLTLVAARAQWLDSPGSMTTGALSLRTPEGWQLSFAQCPPVGWLRELLEGARR